MERMQYPKINSLWKREGWYFDEKAKADPSYQCKRQSFIVGDYACPEFESVSLWEVEEKIDGTNIRIIWTPQADSLLTFRGRTDKAQIPVQLIYHLQDTFTSDLMFKVFGSVQRVILFGEGYGPKIQAVGGQYSDDTKFVLFDVWVDGWWLNRESVVDCALQLSIPHCPSYGIMTKEQVIDLVKSYPNSRFSKDPDLIIEGVIARAYPQMLFRDDKTPIMFKLKCKDMQLHAD